MLSIGAFAQLGQVTHRMLRHWDTAGLLVEAVGSGVVTTQKPGAGEALPASRRVSILLAEAGR